MAKRLNQIRWTVVEAAPEFDINPKTLSKRIKTGNTVPGSDGKFSTVQICAAAFGDIQGERLRKTRAEADEKEIKNKRMLGRLIDRDVVSSVINRFAATIRAKVMASPLPIEDRNEILNDLKSLAETELENAEEEDSKE